MTGGGGGGLDSAGKNTYPESAGDADGIGVGGEKRRSPETADRWRRVAARGGAWRRVVYRTAAKFGYVTGEIKTTAMVPAVRETGLPKCLNQGGQTRRRGEGCLT